MKLFKVGGAVRDELLGVPSKDIDFTVEAPSFDAMRAGILEMEGKIFVETPEFLTIRAKVPELGAADFVLARKESGYTDGRHPDSVVAGTIFDDLARRDFTMNAIAIDMETGEFIDPHNGLQSIRLATIFAVGNAEDRFREDPLRIVRAVRFAITKGFRLDHDIRQFMSFGDVTLTGVSKERIFDEVNKMFGHDTLASIRLLEEFPRVRDEMFANVRLRADLRP